MPPLPIVLPVAIAESRLRALGALRYSVVRVLAEVPAFRPAQPNSNHPAI